MINSTSVTPQVQEIIADIVEAHPERAWIVPRTVGIAGKIGHGKSTIARMFHAKFGHQEIAFADHLRHTCEALLGLTWEYMTDAALKNAPLIGRHNGYPFPFDPRDPFAITHQVDIALGVVYGTLPDFFAHSASSAGKQSLIGANELSPRVVRERVQVEFTRAIWVPLCNGKIFSPREILQLVGTDIFRAVDPPVWVWAWSQSSDEIDVVAPDVRFPNEAEVIKRRGGIVIKVICPGQQAVSGHVSETSLDKRACDFELINDGSLEDLWRAVVDILDIYAETHKADVDTGPLKRLTV